STAPLDGELVPSDARRDLAPKVGCHGEAVFLRRLDEWRRDRGAVRQVRKREHVLGAVAAAPSIDAAGEGFGAPEGGQQVGVAPPLGTTVVRGRVATLVGEGVDRA